VRICVVEVPCQHPCSQDIKIYTCATRRGVCEAGERPHSQWPVKIYLCFHSHGLRATARGACRSCAAVSPRIRVSCSQVAHARRGVLEGASPPLTCCSQVTSLYRCPMLTPACRAHPSTSCLQAAHARQGVLEGARPLWPDAQSAPCMDVPWLLDCSLPCLPSHPVLKGCTCEVAHTSQYRCPASAPPSALAVPSLWPDAHSARYDAPCLPELPCLKVAHARWGVRPSINVPRQLLLWRGRRRLGLMLTAHIMMPHAYPSSRA
jgi:hypothetical protein